MPGLSDNKVLRGLPIEDVLELLTSRVIGCSYLSGSLCNAWFIVSYLAGSRCRGMAYCARFWID